MIEQIIKEVINNYIQENLLNESRGVSANQYSSTIHSIVKLIEKPYMTLLIQENIITYQSIILLLIMIRLKIDNYIKKMKLIYS